ncbi:MAG: hypothetical protein HKN73_19785, partial [Gemmatimonadetes bacterium]|nr:hypothetical protein [Gemmatimonadota bacterium]
MLTALDRARTGWLVLLISLSTLAGACGGEEQEPTTTPVVDESLEELFQAWRDFEAPEFVDGVPDYTADAMAAQAGALGNWVARLDDQGYEALDTSKRIDWHLVRAEVHGLDFDHRVRRPWARDPAFYVWI